MFHDRQAAGRELAVRLLQYRDADPLVLGVPRGGVIVAAEVARILRAPLDVLISRKIRAPFNQELALGAVAADGIPLFDARLLELAGLSREDLQGEVDYQLKEIQRRLRVYRGDREPVSHTGRTVIVVDDGIATGSTLRAGLRWLRRQRPGRLLLAVPVAPPEALEQLRREVDEVVCLETPAEFYAVGQFYEDFQETTDAEVLAALAHNNPPYDSN